MTDLVANHGGQVHGLPPPPGGVGVDRHAVAGLRAEREPREVGDRERDRGEVGRGPHAEPVGLRLRNGTGELAFAEGGLRSDRFGGRAARDEVFRAVSGTAREREQEVATGPGEREHEQEKEGCSVAHGIARSGPRPVRDVHRDN